MLSGCSQDSFRQVQRAFGTGMRKHQHASDLLTYGCDHFKFSASVRVRRAVLHIDHSNHPVPPDYRRGKKGFELILGEVFEEFEPGICVRIARDCQQSAFASNPSRQTLIEFETDLTDRG